MQGFLTVVLLLAVSIAGVQTQVGRAVEDISDPGPSSLGSYVGVADYKTAENGFWATSDDIFDPGPSSLGNYAGIAETPLPREPSSAEYPGVFPNETSENNFRIANLTGPSGALWIIPPNTPGIKKFPEPSVSAETQGIVITKDDLSMPEPIPDNVPIIQGDKSDKVSAWDTALAELENQTAGNSPCNCTLETVTVMLTYRCNSTV